MVCGNDLPATKSKPEPDIFLRAAREKLGLSVGVHEALISDAERQARSKVPVFEDGISGMHGAKRAGMAGRFSTHTL